MRVETMSFESNCLMDRVKKKRHASRMGLEIKKQGEKEAASMVAIPTIKFQTRYAQLGVRIAAPVNG